MLKLEACFRALGCLRATATGSNSKTLTPFVGVAFILLFIAVAFWAHAQHRRNLASLSPQLRPDDVTRQAIGF